MQVGAVELQKVVAALSIRDVFAPHDTYISKVAEYFSVTNQSSILGSIGRCRSTQHGSMRDGSNLSRSFALVSFSLNLSRGPSNRK